MKNSYTPARPALPGLSLRAAPWRLTLMAGLLSSLGMPALAASDIVISQVYGGGGNTGALYRNDFIELFNRGASPVNLSNWSVQYGAAANTSWSVTALPAIDLQPGQYLLVQQAKGAGGTQDLPTPDAAGSLSMSGTTGKVLLSNSKTAQVGASPTGAAVIDWSASARPTVSRAASRPRRRIAWRSCARMAAVWTRTTTAWTLPAAA